MIKENKNLINALVWFAQEIWFPLEDSYACIESGIGGGAIVLEELRREYIDAISDADFDWLQLATDTTLLLNPDKYTNTEIKDYVKWLLQDYLFTEGRMNDRQFDLLIHSVMDILGVYTQNDGWMRIGELYNTLKSFGLFSDLQFYELLNIRERAPDMNIKIKVIDYEIPRAYMKYGKA